MPARQKLLLSILALLGVIFVGSLGYYFIVEGISFQQAVFQTVITVSTVGYGKEFNLDARGEWWTILVIIVGVLVVSLAFASLQAMIVGGEFRAVLGRQKLKDRIAKLRGHFIVCGFGRMGSQIAEELVGRGKQVVVVEHKAEHTAKISDQRMSYVLGDAADEKILEDAGIEHASALVTVLRSDADNVFVALTARGMRADLPIIARSEELDTERKLIRAGATRVICPQSIGASRIVNLLARPAVAKLVDLTMDATEWEMEEILVEKGSSLEGKSLKELDLRTRANLMIVAVHDAAGKSHVNPGPNYVVNVNDVLVAIGPAGSAKSLSGRAN
ncbi:MAG TPA: TrkA family potassium uptake protein [Phycisphaerae bacterium]|nr:TrkA family potassium uptake protein [Phycisphaerae bacterium]HRW54006.1 TrkA family potassium uptake protein [Phycisphaerae bacterium]